MRILTFIILEEGKEAEEHERLEVVQGVYWVLKAWRKVQHENEVGRGTHFSQSWQNRKCIFRCAE